jgi:hypothetical protein
VATESLKKERIATLAQVSNLPAVILLRVSSLLVPFVIPEARPVARLGVTLRRQLKFAGGRDLLYVTPRSTVLGILLLVLPTSRPQTEKDVVQMV